MITVKIQPDGLSVDGHAGAGTYGHDIVCASVSAITFTLIYALSDVSEESIDHSSDIPGHVSVKWQKLSDKGRTLVDAWFLGICMIANAYGHIEIL